MVLNRIDPALFEACFMAWAKTLRADAPDLIALDGKTLRRSGDATAGLKPLHVVSAWASTQRLVLAQDAVDAKDNECAAILAILGRLDIKGALVTIDAIATNPTIAQAIIEGGGDYVLAHDRSTRPRAVRLRPRPSSRTTASRSFDHEPLAPPEVHRRRPEGQARRGGERGGSHIPGQ